MINGPLALLITACIIAAMFVVAIGGMLVFSMIDGITRSRIWAALARLRHGRPA